MTPNPVHVAAEGGNTEWENRTMKMQSWDVVLQGKIVDTVFFTPGMTPPEVRASLVDHDRYHPQIQVLKSGNVEDYTEC